MPLATKNNAIIIKDGKIAENCGCCGGWYCCADYQCALSQITSVSATVVSSDFSDWRYSQYGNGNTQYLSRAFLGSFYNGTHALDKSQSNSSVWVYSFLDSSVSSQQQPDYNARSAYITLGPRFNSSISAVQMAIELWFYEFGKTTFDGTYKNPYVNNQYPDNMGLAQRAEIVFIPCPEFQGTASSTFSSVKQSGSFIPSGEWTTAQQSGVATASFSVTWS